MRTSIRVRLVTSYVLLALLSVVAAGLVAQVLVAHEVVRRQAATLQANADAIAMQAMPMLASGARADALAELSRSAAFLLDARVVIETEEGVALGDSGSSQGGQAVMVFDGATNRFLHGAPTEADVSDSSMMRMMIVDGHHRAMGIDPRLDALWSAEQIPDVTAPDGSQVESFTIFMRREAGPWGGRLDFDRRGVEESVPAVPAGAVASSSIFDEGLASGAVTIDLVQEEVRQGDDEAPSTARMVFQRRIVNEESQPLPDGAPGLHGAPAPDGALVAAPLASDGAQTGRIALHVGASDGGAWTFAQRSTARVEAPIGDPMAPIGRVRISDGPDLRPAALAATRHAFSMAAVVAALLAAGVGFVVARGMSAPLGALAETAARMEDGDLAARAADGGTDEIGRLSRQFNRMADALEESFATLADERDALRRFIADASHELRTPITALRNFNELLQGPAEHDPTARAEFLVESAAQLERLEWITTHLLDLSRLEAGLVSLDREPVDLDDVLASAIAPFRPEADERGVDLVIVGSGSSVDVARSAESVVQEVRIDRGRILLALSNLIDNALRHAADVGTIRVGARVLEASSQDSGSLDAIGRAAPGTRVDVRANPHADNAPTESRVLFWVEDDGPGLDASDRDRVFERFFRGRGAPSGGTGLGLAIVEGIAKAHGGTVRVDAERATGARFEIELPAG